ncbi:helix-turn-helix domain-containing protein [Streptococcus plurextorum]|uniref:helix-turn-helix domain-containing protein n=1 Tax=Streptococcus plurextorum TaxID=456876 RepID=UPI0003FAEE49|nr:helix-turn-helix transcriptional regulator [Streptococcus plurextorum]
MISEKLRDYRLQKGLSQEALAEQLGVSRQTISNWETNRRVPDIYSLVALSDLYEISLDHLIKGDAKVMEMLSGKTKKIGLFYLYGTVVISCIGMLEVMYLEDLNSLVRVGFMIVYLLVSMMLAQYYYPYFRKEIKKARDAGSSRGDYLGMMTFYLYPPLSAIILILLNFFYL